jgi:hypothetical protein
MDFHRIVQLASRLRSDDTHRQTFFVLFSTRYSLYRLAIQNSSDIVKSRRGLRTGSRPMESCRPAIIVSFGVTAHWRRKTALVQQESIPWQSFVG